MRHPVPNRWKTFPPISVRIEAEGVESLKVRTQSTDLIGESLLKILI